MKNRGAFRTQLASVMEALAKAAVTEISKLVEDGSVVLRLEVSRSHEEIDRLRRKLQQVESELRAAQEAATRESHSVGFMFENQFEAPEGVFKGGAVAPTLEQVNEKKSKSQTPKARPDFGFAVKEEHEGELVAQILHQTESEHSSGRLNNVSSKCVMLERDHQLPSSVSQGHGVETDDPVCANVTEQCSKNQSVLSPLQHTPATSEMSGSSRSSLEKDYHVFDGGVVKEEAGRQCLYTEESRSEMGDAQQTEHEQPLFLTNGNLNPQFIHPGQQQLHMQIRVTENSPDLVSNCNPNSRILLRPGVGDKTFSCAQCQMRFDHFSDLERHQRVHTGEKPFSCGQCGKRFSLSWNLSRHERIHTGNKPFGCVQCGKRFTQGWNLRVHSRIHTGERPYHCTLCGKSFNQLITLKTHQKIHYRNQ